MRSLIYPDRGFYREVLLFAVPVAIQGIIMDGVNLTDTLMIGALGEQQLSAASLACQFVNTYRSFSMGLSMGASVLASRFWGMQKLDSMRTVTAIMLRLSLALAAVFALLTVLFPQAIMGLYSEEPIIIAYGTEYLRFCAPAYIFNGLTLTTTVLLRCMRQVRLPLLVSVGGFCINIFTNYVFMFGKLGVPAMGIGGAAFSTLLVRFYEFAVICGYLLFVEEQLRFRIPDLFRSSRMLFQEYFRVGLPVLLSDMLLSLGENVVMMIIGRLGAGFVAANAITSAFTRMSGNLIQGVSQASAVIVGNTMGRGQLDETRQQGWGFLGIGIVLGLFTGMVILLLCGPLISLYHLTEETAQITRFLMYAISLTMVFQSANSILTKGALRGGGDTRALLIADNVFLWISSIPFGMLAGFVWHLPVFWIYLLLKSDNVLKCIWCVWRLSGDRWMKPIRTERG